mgnify:CR=1 FL=1
MGCGGSKDTNVEVKEDKKYTPSPAPSAAKTEDVKVEVKSEPKKAEGPARRAGVSAETGEDTTASAKRKKSSVEAMTKPKTEEEMSMIAAATKDSALFAGLTDSQRTEVVSAMFEMKFEPGQTVITQGEKGDNFYVVSSGKYAVFLSQVEDGKKAVKEYVSGGAFGELALMYNCPRAATIRCTEAGAVWALDRGTFRGILMAVHKEELDTNAHFLEAVSLLSPLTDAQRDALGNVLVEMEFGRGETIVREGDLADALYLIKSGEVGAYKDEDGHAKGKLLIKMGQREFFGEAALTGNDEKRAATIVAEEKTKVLKLNRADFAEMFGDLQEVIKFNFNQKVLGSMELFKELSPTERATLVENLVEVTYEKGDAIIKEGEKGDAFYIVKSGHVDVSSTKDGTVNKFAELGPSDYFGEMALMNDEPRKATVTASAHVVVMKLDKKTFKELAPADMLTREAERRKREMEKAQRPPILMKDLKLLSILGVGTFGRVKLVLHTIDSDRPYALKCMRKGQVIALKQVEHVMNEKKLLEACDHPFLLRLAATFQDDNELYMLLELALGGELFSVLRENNKFAEPQGCFYAACVQSAFAYMHDKSIVYRDLKPENLLFDSEGYLKVVDFGFAKQITDRTWTLCGTPEYLAPEIITNKGHNLAVDWWAFGILIFEMLVSQPPFCADDPMDIYQKILRNRVTYPATVSKNARDLITKLLVSNPSQRLGSLKRGHREISSHAFFKTTDWTALVRKELKAPYVPTIKSPTDTSNFDEYEDEGGEDWTRFNDKSKNLFKGF